MGQAMEYMGEQYSIIGETYDLLIKLSGDKL